MELAEAAEKLAARINRAGFADEQDYVLSCLTEADREKLAEREKTLIREKTELETRQRDKAVALAAMRKKHLTDQPLGTLRENISSCDENIKQVRSASFPMSPPLRIVSTPRYRPFQRQVVAAASPDPAVGGFLRCQVNG